MSQVQKAHLAELTATLKKAVEDGDLGAIADGVAALEPHAARSVTMNLEFAQDVVTLESPRATIFVCQHRDRFYRILLLRSSTNGENIIGYDMALMTDEDGRPLTEENLADYLRVAYPEFIIAESCFDDLEEGERLPPRPFEDLLGRPAKVG